MAVCPNCNKIIEELCSTADASTNAIMDEEGEVIIDNEDVDIFETGEWRCPECDETIANNQTEGIKFMKNTDELKKVVENKLKEKTKWEA